MVCMIHLDLISLRVVQGWWWRVLPVVVAARRTNDPEREDDA